MGKLCKIRNEWSYVATFTTSIYFVGDDDDDGGGVVGVIFVDDKGE